MSGRGWQSFSPLRGPGLVACDFVANALRHVSTHAGTTRRGSGMHHLLDSVVFNDCEFSFGSFRRQPVREGSS